MSDRAGTVAAVREFNRRYTKIIGALDEGLLATDFTLTEARVIFELGARGGSDVGTLRTALDIDAGYLSRILTRFERSRLVERERSTGDARRQHVRLTASGEKAYRMLGDRADQQVEQLLAPLEDAGRDRLVAAMRTIERLLASRTPAATTVLRPPRAGDFGWVVQRHGALYAAEYGWNRSFEALVARIVAEFIDQPDQRGQAAWIAEVDGERAGCIFCVRGDDATAKLRLLLVEPWARGHGLGARLVDECLAFARGAGYRRVELWTNDVLTAARRIYERAGFELIASEEHEHFGPRLVGQTWRLQLP